MVLRRGVQQTQCFHKKIHLHTNGPGREKISQKDTRIKLIKNEKNLGAGLSRNIAIKYSQGEYIAFCDCDDLWLPKKLENQLKFIKKK